MLKSLKRLALCAAIACMAVACLQGAEPAKIILDVDLAEDVDDAGALAVLHALADRGEAEILATMVSAKNEWVVPCLDAINTYYGRPNLPIGYQRGYSYGYSNPKDPQRENISKYAEPVAKAFPHDLKKSSDAPAAAELYRKILANQPDHSVTIVTVGFLTNLKDLLDSRPDQHSPLDGEGLVERKVKQWVCMGGIFPQGKFPDGGGEYNLMWDTIASVRAVNDWPTPIVFSGFEIGAHVKVGARLGTTPEANPVRACYQHYNGLQNREAWDQTAVLYAVRGAGDLWRLSEPGFCLMHARVSHGYNEWLAVTNKQHRYLIAKAPPSEVAKVIDDLMVQSPTSKRAQIRDLSPAPRIAMLWASLRGDSSLEAMAKHDLIMVGTWSLGLRPDRQPAGLADGFTKDSIEAARSKVKRLRELNPCAVILGDLPFYEYSDKALPEDHPWWLRKDGKRQQFWPGTHRMNWNDPEYRTHVVRQTMSLKQTGVDGVFYDNLRNEPEPWVAFLTELRQQVGEEFLILLNSGYAVGAHDFVAPFINGFMYESGWSHNRKEWDEAIRKLQHTETLLRRPTISVIERFEETRDQAGWPGDGKHGQRPPADPAARRWSMAFALTMGDFFYLFSDNTSHKHNWYPEYDQKIGKPLAPAQRLNSHAWQRDYEHARVVVNLPGAQGPHTVSLDHQFRDALTGEEGAVFIIPPGEGRVLRRL